MSLDQQSPPTSRPLAGASNMHSTPQSSGPERRTLPPEYQIRHSDEEVMNALVVEDSPQIAERLVELVSVPNRVEVVATAATEDEALAACDQQHVPASLRGIAGALVQVPRLDACAHGECGAKRGMVIDAVHGGLVLRNRCACIGVQTMDPARPRR